MKRRYFLSAAAASLSLLCSEAWAAKKKPAASSKTSKSGRKSNKSHSREKTSKPKGPVTHTADDSIIEKPPVGSSASRLPPVKAPEPPTEWRTWEITTRITLPLKNGPTRLWLPLPLNQDTLFQRTLGHEWQGNAALASIKRLPEGDLEAYYCEWPTGGQGRLQLTTLVTTADRHFDVTRRTVAPEREDILRRNLQPSSLIPNDGLAHQLGERIIGRIKDPVAQAKAIYDWVVDHTIYDPALPPCGNGDVRRQLITGQYGGRSADINGLFVSICRAVGIPARCVYGLRIGPSRLLRGLGLLSEEASRSQHVRAEFYIPGYGWIPVDPSDVRRAIAIEAISDNDPRSTALRRVLFGIWEMNWLAYNVGNDLTLPGQYARLPFFIQPVLELNGGDLVTPEIGGMEHRISARRVEI